MSLTGMAALAMAAIATPSPAAHELKIERFGLYVVSDDLSRSALFYGQLFDKKPQVTVPGMTGFDVAGALFAVVDREQFAPDARLGNTTIPYIKVADVDAYLAHVRKVAPSSLVTPEVQGEGGFRFIKLRDPDGNLLEFFSLQPAP